MSDIQVSTVRQGAKAPFIEVFTSVKGKNGEVIPPGNRLRSILIREWDLNSVPGRFAPIVFSALLAAARDRLAQEWKKNPGLTTMPAASFELPGLLAWIEAQRENAGKLSKEDITSAVKGFLETLPENKVPDATAILESFSGPARKGNLRQTETLHQRLVAFVAELEDEGEILPRLLAMMESRLVKLREEEATLQVDSF